MRKFYTFLLFLTFLLYGKSSFSQQLTSEQWNEDIDFLVSKMAKTIPEFATRVNQDKLISEVEQLKTKLSTYSEEQIVVALRQILSFANDEGCDLYPFQGKLNYGIAPLKLYWFDDGIYICDAIDTYKHLVNQKIIAINGIEIDSLYSLLSNSISADNEYYRKYKFLYIVQIPALLHAAHIGLDQSTLIFTLENGNTESVIAGDVDKYVELKRNLAGYKQLSTNSVNHIGENYWMEYIPESESLFVQFLQIRNNKEGISFNDFVKKIEEELDKGKVEKLIIDNRYGGGGDGFKLKPFTDMVKNNEAINQQGKLFVLTSRSTRGTVMELSAILELNTKAIFIGEPTGEGPNSVGDNKQVELPNSRISVSLTHTFWPTSWDGDTRTYLEPDVMINYSFKNYSDQIDPWMNEVNRYVIKSKKRALQLNLVKELKGNYVVEGRKVELKEINESLFLSMDRKMKSFFELNTNVYFLSESKLSTDVSNVFINYTKDVVGKYHITSIDWKGKLLKVED